MAGRVQVHRKIDTRALFQSPDAVGTALLVAATHTFGPELLDWDPETIRLELEEAVGEPAEANLNKLFAALRIVKSDAFYKQLPEFIQLCNALFSGAFDPRVFDPADALEIAWGVTEAMLLWPPDPRDDAPFSQEILAYIREIVRMEGLYSPPDVLRLGGAMPEELQKIQTSFGDDPELSGSIMQMQDARNQEIDAIVRARLNDLFEQLLPYSDAADVAELIDKVRQTR